MTPHSVRLYEGPESVPQPLPGSGSPTVVASNDAQANDEASTAQHPAHPASFLRLYTEHTEEPQPAPIDQLALVTLMCEMRRMQGEIAELKQIKRHQLPRGRLMARVEFSDELQSLIWRNATRTRSSSASGMPPRRCSKRCTRAL
jgi:hypothetical protein